MSLSSKHSAEVILLFSNRSTIMASFCRYLQYFYYFYEIAWYKKKTTNQDKPTHGALKWTVSYLYIQGAVFPTTVQNYLGAGGKG